MTMSHLQDNFARIFTTNPAAPPPISPEEFEALRVRADLDYQQHRESGRAHRALQDQVQHMQSTGVWQ